MQNYEIHLYVPKTDKLTPSMMDWLYEHGQDTSQPETFWPVRRLKPRVLARRTRPIITGCVSALFVVNFNISPHIVIAFVAAC